MKTAQNWFSPGSEEEGQEPKTTENLESIFGDLSTTAGTTTTTTTASTASALKRVDYSDNSNNNNDDDDDYYYDDSSDGRPFRADVIDAVPPMAVRYLLLKC